MSIMDCIIRFFFTVVIGIHKLDAFFLGYFILHLCAIRIVSLDNDTRYLCNIIVDQARAAKQSKRDRRTDEQATESQP